MSNQNFLIEIDDNDEQVNSSTFLQILLYAMCFLIFIVIFVTFIPSEIEGQYQLIIVDCSSNRKKKIHLLFFFPLLIS